MKNLARVLRIAVGYRLTLVGIVVSSTLVAVLWGGNIGAVYPVLEIALRGRSLQHWVDQEIAGAQQRATELQGEIRDLQAAGRRATAIDQQRQLQRELVVRQTQLQAEQTCLRIRQFVRPLIYRYLPQDAFQTIVWIVLALILSTAVKGVLLFVNLMLLARLSQMTAFRLRRDFFHHWLQMDLHEFGEERTSDLLSRFNTDINYLTGALTTLFGSALREPLKMGVCFLGAAVVSWRLLLFCLIFTPLAALLIRQLAGSIKRASRRAMEEVAQLYGVLSETFDGIQTVQAYTMEKFARSRFHSVSRECLRKALRIVFYNAVAKPVTEMLSLGVIALAIIAGAYLVLNQETHVLGIKLSSRPLSMPSLLVFFGFLIGASDPARKLGDVFSQIQGGAAAADRLLAMLDRQPSIVSPEVPRPLPRPLREITFDNIHFCYSAGQPVLRGIDLKVQYGETIAIVGPNGCGKTTLVNLLPRFMDPQQGTVSWNDVDLRQADLRGLRRRIGFVAQRTLLFDDTVANNIRFGSLKATDEQVVEAAKKAHAHHFITERLEKGYDHIVGTGGKSLSDGQRQRICLARAILRDPEVLVLDEATSHLDLESEQLIHQALAKFVRGRTVFIVTHRLSTLALATRIVVMEGGRILDVGQHDELFHRCPLYRRLHELQFRKSA